MASFIDQGYCFNAGEWTFPDFPLRGVYPQNEVYARVNGWESFEPWLSRIERLDEDAIWRVAGEISGMVWRIVGRTGGAGAAADRKEDDCTGVDSAVSRVAAEAVSGVGGELGFSRQPSAIR